MGAIEIGDEVISVDSEMIYPLWVGATGKVVGKEGEFVVVLVKSVDDVVRKRHIGTKINFAISALKKLHASGEQLTLGIE